MTKFYKWILAFSAVILVFQARAAVSNSTEGVYERPKTVQVYFGSHLTNFEGRLKNQIIKEARSAGLTTEEYILDGKIEDQIRNIKQNSKPHVPIIIKVADREYDDYYASEILNLNLPLIFVLRRPSSDKLKNNSTCWFVRGNSIESGLMLGQTVYEYIQTNPNWDINGNGVLDVLLITGTEGHRDTRNRTERTFELLDARKVKYEIKEEIAGNFDYEHTINQLAAIFDSGILSDIDVIIAHNDDMALAAITVLVDYGDMDPHKKGWPGIFGVDGSFDAQVQIAEGYMTNTVVQDVGQLAKVCVSLALDHRDLTKFIDEDQAVIRDNDIQLPNHIFKPAVPQ